MTLAWLNDTLDAVEQYPLTLLGLQARYPNVSFPSDITSWEPGHPSEPNLPERVVIVRPTTPPAIEWGQSLSHIVVFDTDHWEEEWTISEITIQEARRRLRQMARGILMDRVEQISPVELAAFREVQTLQLAQDLLGIDQAQYPLIQAVAAYHSITFGAAATYLQDWHDIWNGIADNYIGKYFDVIDRIQSAATVADAHAIYLELESMA